MRMGSAPDICAFPERPEMSGGLARSSIGHVALAFLAMGSWAAFVNRAHQMPQPLVAGVVQGLISGLITLFLKRMIETLSARVAGPGGLIVPPMVAVATSLLILTTVHRFAGTPEIRATIALPLTVTAIYAALYSFALWRSRP